jgi:hypothetical protein
LTGEERKDATELIALGPEVIRAGVGATTPTLQQVSRTCLDEIRLK